MPMVTCQNCGREFRVPPSTLARGSGKYCSRACFHVPVTLICANPNCRKSFRVPPSETSRIQCCSTPCQFVLKRLQALARPLDERFWTKVHKTTTCWLWTGAKDAFGYGRISIIIPSKGKRSELAHRISYMLTYGSLQDDINVLHNCPGGDNPACVNPAHLWLGTHQDNTQDAITKGRFKYLTPRYGEAHGMHRLSDDDVRTIRRLQGQMSGADIARHYGVSRTTISRILLGKQRSKTI